MKQFITFAIALLITTSSFAQKKELKVAKKALKKNSYIMAINALSTAKPLINEGTKDKYKAQYYFFLGKANYANGTTPQNFTAATEAFNSLFGLNNKASSKYTTEANNIVLKIKNSIYDAASQKFNEAIKTAKENPDKSATLYVQSAEKFNEVYEISKHVDTVALHQSARSYFFAKKYQKSIDLSNQLLDLGYTGLGTQYKALNVVNSQPIYFNTKKEMDRNVKMKLAKDPEVVVFKSQRGFLLKMIAKSYVNLNQNEKALEAIAVAKKESPDDYGLLVDEANVYYAMDNKVMFKEKLEEATKLNPTDATLHFNIGVMKGELGDPNGAVESYKKAIELKPDYFDAYNNIGAVTLEKAAPLVEEMNNTKDFDKYDQLQAKQLKIYKEALPFYEKAFEIDNSRVSVVQTLMGIYSNLEMDDKAKDMKAVYDNLKN